MKKNRSQKLQAVSQTPEASTRKRYRYTRTRSRRKRKRRLVTHPLTDVCFKTKITETKIKQPQVLKDKSDVPMFQSPATNVNTGLKSEIIRTNSGSLALRHCSSSKKSPSANKSKSILSLNDSSVVSSRSRGVKRKGNLSLQQLEKEAKDDDL